MSQNCKELHERIESLPLMHYPFALEQLPRNGIYFFYETGETWGHGGEHQRIVRIGSHRQGNFKSRIGEHYLLKESAMDFDKNKPKPSDRSIFRKNIGRAVLWRDGDDYCDLWEIDFTYRANRDAYKHLRNIRKEKKIEAEITRIMRDRFAFRFIEIDDEKERIGKNGLEKEYIATASGCQQCTPSETWLGRFSPVARIRDSGLWLVQYNKARGPLKGG